MTTPATKLSRSRWSTILDRKQPPRINRVLGNLPFYFIIERGALYSSASLLMLLVDAIDRLHYLGLNIAALQCIQIAEEAWDEQRMGLLCNDDPGHGESKYRETCTKIQPSTVHVGEVYE